MYPVWYSESGTHPNIIVVSAHEIINVVGMIKQHDRPTMRHLVPPREKIWAHTLMTTAEIDALSTILPQ
jgi:hypothetical protein